ncbi:hypothetical protein GCE9029_03466 [Grimontia celer]|uniref:Uncharacterized protein n=1 Tax=Grimontia celer TaxID=1796497 RepID=A0A128F7S7_9GAMM|nr:hypothetical protein [Grimontia celer]CZF82829.1 hypothetical protein GCE9029_03466 [Grimontia celer]
MALDQRTLTLISPMLAYTLLLRGLAWLVLPLFLLSGCASDNTRSDTWIDFSQIKDDEVMVVGKISIIPAVIAQDLKQETDTFRPFANERALLWISDDVGSNKERLGLLADWDETFYFALPRQTMRLSELERAFDEDDELVYRALPLPEMMKFLVRVDDRAIYVGNLRLYVDEYDQIVALEVVDESAAAQQAFQRRFGTTVRPRVSLMAPEAYFR